MLKLIKRFTKREWFFAALCLVFIVIQIGLNMAMPQYMSQITILVETPGSEMSAVWAAGGMMLLCAFGSLIASVISTIFTSLFGSGFAYILRDNIFKKVESFSMGEIGRFSTASLITRSINDIQQVLMFVVMGIQMMIVAPITAIWAIAKIFDKEWQWTLSLTISVVILLAVVGVCIGLTMPKFRRMQELTDDLNRVTRENLSGINVVRAYNAEDYQEKKFEDANKKLTDTHLFTQHTMAFMMPTIQLVMSGLSLAVYWLGASLISNAATPGDRIALFGDMMVFTQYGMQVVMSFMMMVVIFMLMPRSLVSAQRINEVLDTEVAIKNGSKTEGLPGLSGDVEFRNVSFRYPDAEEDVIHNISFSAKKGETVAIIGSTGCGKSTVINLIPRFYDATDGEVLVDGVNVKEYDEQALRNKISYVSQSAILFSGTIRSNIAYGDNGGPAPDQQAIEEAIRTAQAEDFVLDQDETYDAYVARGGTNFSGGQKQRLSIARAIARKSEIIIFDDSFSALDYRTDRALRKALDEECGDVTRFIVAQRIGTIRNADRIIVLDDGCIAGIGTHSELMKNCEVYQQIALSQLSEKELA